jgi:hypothetical protein
MACLANGESLRFWQAANTIVVNLRNEVQQGYGNGPNGSNKLMANHRKKSGLSGQILCIMLIQRVIV